MHITTSSLLFNDTFFRCKISINIQCLNWHTGTKKLQNSQTYSLKKCIQGGQNLPKKINIHVPQFETLEYTYHSPQRTQIEKVTYFNVPTFHYHLLWPKTYPKSTFFKQNTSSKGNNLCFIVLYPYCKKWLKNDQFHPFHLVSSCYFLDFGVLWVWSETILLGNWQLHIIISTKMPS